MVEQEIFQSLDGGSIPTSPLQFKIEPCRFADIRHIFERFHYKGGHMGGGISYCFKLEWANIIAGGAVCGKLRQEKAYGKHGKTIEIRRMACLDDTGKNFESYFLGKVAWWLRKNSDVESVISYSDRSVGHSGTIYRAANFQKIGETAKSKHVFWNGVRYHPRSLTIDRPYSYRLREAIKTGEAQIKEGDVKDIWLLRINRGKK